VDLMALGRLLTRRGRRDQHERAAGAGFQVVIDGQPVNHPMSLYRGGMGIPGAWRSSLIIADLLGSVPWDAWREVDGLPAEKVMPRPMLLEQPSVEDERMTTFSSWGLDLVWHGNAVGIWAARDGDGVPQAVVPVPAEYVGVRRVGWEYQARLPIGPIKYQIGGREFDPWEILHIKGPCPPGEVRGFGVLEAHLTGLSSPADAGTLDLARELQRQAQSISQHGVPSGYLKTENPDTTPEQLKENKRVWLESQRDRTIAALNAAVEFEAIAWNPTDMQLLEARKMSLLEQALVFGLPPSFLGVETSNRTYRNDNAEDVKLVKWTMRGHLGRFEAALSRALPPGEKAMANVDDVVRADMLTRYQAHALALGKKPWRTTNEVRRAEGEPPLPGGDELPEPTEPTEPEEPTDDRQEDDREQDDRDEAGGEG
jgi:HK97 family phage portal protein